MMKCSNGLFLGSLDDRYKNRGQFIAFPPLASRFLTRPFNFLFHAGAAARLSADARARD